MKTIVQFTILKGAKYYVAQGVDLPIVTQAKTLDVFAKNIKEAVELHFRGEKISRLGFVRKPSILVNFELPAPNYA